MKKILFATTALVATAGVASADVTLGGSANMGVAYFSGSSATQGDFIVKNEIDFDIIGSGTSDGGIEFGASVDIDASERDGSVTQGSTGSNNIQFDPEVFVSAGGLTLTIGNLDEATDDMGMGDIGFDGLAIDDVAETMAGNGADVGVTYEFGDYTFMATYGSNSTVGANNDWSVVFKGEAAGLSYAIGYAEVATLDNYGLNLGYSFGDFGIEATYESAEQGPGLADNDGYGLRGTYNMGALTLIAAAAWRDIPVAEAPDGFTGVPALADDAYGIGATYNLGGGLTLAGGVAAIGSETAADFGVTMRF